MSDDSITEIENSVEIDGSKRLGSFKRRIRRVDPYDISRETLPTNHSNVMVRLDRYERRAKAIAEFRGYTSCLQTINESITTPDGEPRQKEYSAGKTAEPLSAFDFAYSTEIECQLARETIKKLEAAIDDPVVTGLLFEALRNVAAASENYHRIERRWIDREFIAGSGLMDGKSGASVDVQLEAVAMYHSLMRQAERQGRKRFKFNVETEVAKKYSRSRRTIDRWVKNYN